MYACLAVTCHLHVCQNDRDIVRATAVTRGWNVYWCKSTLEKKILLPLLQGFEPATFQSRVRCSNHWAGLLLATHLFLLSAEVGIFAVYVRPSGLQDHSCILVMVPASFSWTCLRKISDSTVAMTKTDLFLWWVILFILYQTVIMFAEARIYTSALCHDGTTVHWETASGAHARTWATVDFRKRQNGTVLHKILLLFVSVNN